MLEEKRRFLERCNQKDREKLSGKRKMSFEDFERFLFLVQSLKYFEYEKEIWQTFSTDFVDRFTDSIEFAEDVEDELGKREEWLRKFLEKVE